MEKLIPPVCPVIFNNRSQCIALVEKGKSKCKIHEVFPTYQPGQNKHNG